MMVTVTTATVLVFSVTSLSLMDVSAENAENITDAADDKPEGKKSDLTVREELRILWKTTEYYNRTGLDVVYCTNRQRHLEYNGLFFCPWVKGNNSIEMTNCCGPDLQKYCCKPAPPAEKIGANEIALVSSIVASVVLISTCVLLYCCCCQRRSGVHSGKKLLWVRRGKNKEIYLDTEPNNPEHADAELVGFTVQDDNDDDSEHKDRRPSMISRSSSKKSQHRGSPKGRGSLISPQEPDQDRPEKGHYGCSMAIPKINVQASTPT